MSDSAASQREEQRRRGRTSDQGFSQAATIHLAIVIVVAAASHLTFYRATPVMVWLDSLRYAIHAREFSAGLTSAQWNSSGEPGYPFFLWLLHHWVTTTRGVVLVQQVLAVLTCLILWRAVRAALGPRAALFGTLVVALAPARHYYAQAVLRESLAEFLLVSGLGLVMLAGDASFRRRFVMRTLAGLALGAATLVRFNLAPAMLLATVAPPTCADGKRGRSQPAALMLATMLGWSLLVLPWLGLNAKRGTDGSAWDHYVGNMTRAYADFFEIPGEIGDVHQTRGAQRWPTDVQRFLTHPRAYLHATCVAAGALINRRIWGDVAPLIPLCEAVRPDSALPGFAPSPSPQDGKGRRRMHARLCSIYRKLIQLGWLGLLAWGTAAVFQRRFDHVLVAAAPLACILSLSMLLVANTRYAFPCEALVLGFGLPGAWLLASRFARVLVSRMATWV